MVAPEVFEAMLPFLKDRYGNPSSMHRFGGLVRKYIDIAREHVAALIGAHPSEIYFTGCGSESDNMALRGFCHEHPGRAHLITSSVEHPAIQNCCRFLKNDGAALTEIGVDEMGMLRADMFEKVMLDRDTLVTLMWANNETGVLFPIEKLAERTKSEGAFFHTDAVQAVGKIPIDCKKVPIDMLSLSVRHIDEKNPRVKGLRDRLERELLARCKGAKRNGDPPQRLPNTSNISYEFIEGEGILLLLDEKGIAASSGSACTTGSLQPSHVMMAMGLPYTLAHSSIRLSLSRYTTDADIDAVIDAMPPIVDRLRSLSPYIRDSANG